ncbi:MAG: hypothetical protein LBU41_00280 [Clostridiales Family XIII bacterium]|jgi:hypothetical protein|nr:hypothetical protein [Clostridiales Family XIII bacterium]
MKDFSIEQSSYNYLLESFGKEKLDSRHDFVYELMHHYIETEKIDDKVRINDILLCHAILDYFADVHRIREFHPIDRINEDKIHAYMAYWLLRRKPIQLLVDDEQYAFVNENFVLTYLESYLFHDEITTLVAEKYRSTHDLFYRTLLYFFKYRSIDPQGIELMLLAYRGGRSFQYSADISGKKFSEINASLPTDVD